MVKTAYYDLALMTQAVLGSALETRLCETRDDV